MFIPTTSIAQVQAAGIDGWADDSGSVWTYASTSPDTFTTAGDRTAVFSKGTRIKMINTTLKYFVVASSSFGAGTTTVTVTGGTDYSLAAVAISANSYSYAANPQGYPGYFNYAPTFTGFSADPAVGDGSSRFAVNGRTCIWEHNYNTAGTSNATGFTVTLPIASASYFRSWLLVLDNSAARAALGMISINSTTVAGLFTDGTGAAWTGSGTKNGRFVLVYQV